MTNFDSGTVFWLGAVVGVLLLATILLWPRRRGRSAGDREATNVALYRQRRAELAIERADGRLTEAEHATALRSARDLMDRAQHDPLEDAESIARSGGDGPGVAYLRDHSDELLSALATRQAEAAQVLHKKCAQGVLTAEEQTAMLADILAVPMLSHGLADLGVVVAAWLRGAYP